MMRDVVTAMCEFEKEFPTTFLNIMSHLPVHLVEQLFKCSPVHCRWMYPIERYMKTLKDYVRTFVHLEGSIAEGYRMEETLGFCIEYMRTYGGTVQRVWDATEEPIMNDEILRSNSKRTRKMSDEFRSHAHAFVLDNAASLEQWHLYVILSNLPNLSMDMFCQFLAVVAFFVVVDAIYVYMNVHVLVNVTRLSIRMHTL